MIFRAHDRFNAIETFEIARRRARWGKIWSGLTKRENQLLNFTAIKPMLPQKHYRGVMDIPVRDIVGSVGRQRDFNRQFYPLKDTLGQRWARMFLLADTLGWPPIEVHKVGNLYFVEDGHHRVSVAHYLNHAFIEAVVWDYRLDIVFDPKSSLDELLAQLKRARGVDRACPNCPGLAPTAVCC